MTDTLEKLLPRKAAIIAHQDRESILLVRMVGYAGWRIPYADFATGEYPIETARRALKDVVSPSAIKHAQDIGEDIVVEFSVEDTETWDERNTAAFHRGRILHIYVAALAPGQIALGSGGRFEAAMLARRERLSTYLSAQEYESLEGIFKDIAERIIV